MARQFRSDDSSFWNYRYGIGGYTASIGTETASWDGSTRFYQAGAFAATAGSTTVTTKPTGWTQTSLVLIHQTQGTGAGNFEFNLINFSTMTAALPFQNTYGTGAQVVTLDNYGSGLGYGNVTVSGTLTIPSWDGTKGGILPIFANGTITVSGSIVANGVGFRGGPSVTSNAASYQGEGYTANGAVSTAANTTGGSGLAGSSHTAGGSGGNATGGGADFGSIGGGTVGIADLTTLFLGGGGGSGGTNNGSATASGAGGGGGGIIILVGRKIVVSGSVTANGASGANATGTSGGGGLQSGGGGGGAGGSILLLGQQLTLGTSLLSATGGNAGKQTDGTNGTGVGGVGRIHSNYFATLSGTTSPTIDTRTDTILSDSNANFLFNML